MSAEAIKRGRGRPRKDGQPVQQSKPANPDCEPATKGYVKCLMRAFQKEQIIKNLKHQQGGHLINCVMWVALAIFFGVMYILTDSIYAAIGGFISFGFIADHFIDYQGVYDTIRCSYNNTGFIEGHIPPDAFTKACDEYNQKIKSMMECEE